MVTADSVSWEKRAFEKLAQLGAIVMLPYNGKYLMQVAGEGDESEEGKFRPPGGHKNKSDKNLEATIVREVQEEFALSKPQVTKNLKFLGYEYREPFWGNAVFRLENHGLHPGEYQASNSKTEKINLVEAGLDSPDYVGPDPALLLTEEEKKDAEETEAETKSALTWDLFKAASDKDLHDLFKPDYTPEEMEEKARSQTRLYHRLAPRLASMRNWPKEWVRDQDPNGWIEWYEQYYGGRRSTDDRRQIRRWLNFKARHGASFKAKPSPRRAWALINWAIDPLKLIPEDKRKEAEKAMHDYRDTVDGRYKSDDTHKAAARAGLEKPIKFGRFITEAELLAIGSGMMDPKTLGPLEIVSPDGERQSLISYIKEGAFHGHTFYSCGCDSHCRCPHKEGTIMDERHVDYECPLCKAGMKKKAAGLPMLPGTPDKPAQGAMSGQSIDSGAPGLVPPPAAFQQSDVPLLVTDEEAGITGIPKKIDWSARLRRLAARRGEDPDALSGGLASDYFISESMKNASLFTERELRERTRQACVEHTGNSNPTPDEVKTYAEQRLQEICEEQEKSAIHERVVASAKEGTCPRCGVSEHSDTSILHGRIRCGACGKVTSHTEWGVSKVASSVETKGEVYDRHESKNPEPSLGQPVQIPDPRRPKPPRMGAQATGDQLKPASATGEQGPALDIPASSTPATHVKTPMAENQPVQPVSSPFEMKVPQSIQQDQQAAIAPTIAGKAKPIGSGPSIADVAWPLGHMTPAISQGINSLPMSVLGQQSEQLSEQRQQHPLPQTHMQLPSPQPLPQSPPVTLPHLQKTAMAIDSAGIPTTGPEAIYYALQNLDLKKKQDEAENVVRRRLKSKRPDAVKVLGYIQGMAKAGIHPHELMISRVPVIPPQFRPYSVAGDTFVPGDANELYRDLINLVGVHGEIEQNLGRAGSGFSRLNVYDAVKAVYGFGEPTSPKTRERGVSGFLTKVVGTGPKFSFPQAKLLAKDMDFTGNSVIGVDPDLGLDEIGIPDEMAWKLYAPYIQRRLVRSGMSPEQAVKHIADRGEMADKHLNLEMRERPVVYGRQPSWHKYNVIGGWPKRIKGNMIRINPLVTTGMNADFDGDTLNVHLPSMPESVQDAKEKLMASKQLFSMKDRNKVMPLPKQEFVLGLYNAQRRSGSRIFQFPDEHAALAAIKSGKVRLSDDITVGKHKFTFGDRPTVSESPLSAEEQSREALTEFKS